MPETSNIGDFITYQENDKVVELEIPPRHAWLESDNHNFQSGQYPDSLRFGPIPLEEVWGRVVWGRASDFPFRFCTMFQNEPQSVREKKVPF